MEPRGFSLSDVLNDIRIFVGSTSLLIFLPKLGPPVWTLRWPISKSRILPVSSVRKASGDRG